MVCLNLYALEVVKAVKKITTKIMTILVSSMKINAFHPSVVKYTNYFTTLVLDERSIAKVRTK